LFCSSVVVAIGVVAVVIGEPSQLIRHHPLESLSPRSSPKAENGFKSTNEARKVVSRSSPHGTHESKPRSFRRTIRHLHPYYCLALLAAPVAIVEPLKMTGLIVTGSGHWLAGLVMLAAAYALSLLLVNRLFRIVQPRLLALPWFRHSRRMVLRFRRRCFVHISRYSGAFGAELRPK
jgi:hypothetical protein